LRIALWPPFSDLFSWVPLRDRDAQFVAKVRFL
jgi:hypothetical protein